MAVRINPNLIDDLERYGAEDVSKCFHCGNCAAACSFSKAPFVFPRKTMRYLQMGLEKHLRSAAEPWLCYYCGACTMQCPRGADPGETMMSMRRWLTSQYDFTGISKLFYRSWKLQLLITLLLALLTGAGLAAYGRVWGGGDLAIYDGPHAFLSAHAIHAMDWVMGGTLFTLLMINCLRMWYFLMQGRYARSMSAGAYLRSFFLLPQHYLTQKRYRQCDNNKGPWLMHWMIMAGYTTMLVLIVFFLAEMQAGPEIRWLPHLFGYLASIGLVTGLAWAMRSRYTGTGANYQKHTHPTDWIFLGNLFFIVVTGISQHILHRAGLPLAANIAYIVHLMGVVAFEVTQVPFGKWSHLAYRPLAMYFAGMQQEAYEAETAAVALPETAEPQLSVLH
jgi:ferredoxin